MKKILFYYHHFGGLGHGMRILALARALKRYDSTNKILVINSGKPQPELNIEKYAKVVNLPYFEANEGLFSGLKADEDIEDRFKGREIILSKIIGSFMPELAVVEHFPFGRDSLEEELISFVNQLKREGCLVYSSVRDIIEQNVDEEKLDQVIDLFNGVFVHSDEKDGFITSFSVSDKLKNKLVLTGRVFFKKKDELLAKDKIREQLGLKDEKLIVASIGGGIDGVRILDALIDMKGWLDTRLPCLLLISTGTAIDEKEFKRLNVKAEAGKKIMITKFNPNYLDYVNASDLVISRGGYNSVNDILLTGVSNLVVPRESDDEQIIRSKIFSEYLNVFAFDNIDIKADGKEVPENNNVFRMKVLELLEDSNGDVGNEVVDQKAVYSQDEKSIIFPEMIERIGTLKYLKLRITNVCDCSCDMCSWHKRPKEMINLAKIKEIVDDGHKLGVKVINLTGGEPTMHPDFKQIVSYIRDKGIGFSLSTNLGFSEELSKFIIKNNPIAVDFSLDATNDEKFDKWRGCKGLFDRMKTNLRMLRENLPDLFLTLNYTARDDNIEYAEKVLKFAHENKINKVSYHPVEATALNENEMGTISLSKTSFNKFYLEIVPKLLKWQMQNKNVIPAVEISPFFMVNDGSNSGLSVVAKDTEKMLDSSNVSVAYKRKVDLLFDFLNNKEISSNADLFHNFSFADNGFASLPCNIASSLRVNMDGEFSPCCRLDTTDKFGKLADKSLFEHWVRLPYRNDKGTPFADCFKCWNNSTLFGCIPNQEEVDHNLVADKHKIDLMIEPTNRCNLNCITCFTHTGGRKKTDMTLEQFKVIIDRNKGSINNLTLHNYGEPFLNKDLIGMIKYSRKNGIKYVKVSTNGLLLKGDIVQAVLDSGLNYISLSVDGASQETYSFFRKGGNLKELIDNITALVERRNKSNSKLKIEMQFIIMEHNKHELVDIKKLARKLGVDYLRLKRVCVRDKKWNYLIPKEDRLNRYYNVRDKGICDKPLKELIINSDGTVLPCCEVYGEDINKFNFGNIFDKTIAEIIKVKDFKDFIHKSITKKDENSCCAGCNEGNVELDYQLIDLRTLQQEHVDDSSIDDFADKTKADKGTPTKLANVLALHNLDVPRKLQIEFDIPIGCNANCMMCNGRIAKDKNFSYSLLKEKLEHLDTELVSTIKLLGGEPLLDYDELVDFIRFASKKGFNVVFPTNGYLLSESYIDGLINAGLKQFNISLDSDIGQQHDEIRGLKGCFDNIVNAIKHINKNHSDIPIYIEFVMMIENIHRIKNFIGFCEGLGVKGITFTQLDDYGKNYDKLKVDDKELARVKQMIMKNRLDDVLDIDFFPPGNFRKKSTDNLIDMPVCDYVSMKIKISSSGRIRPCPMDVLEGISLNRQLRNIFKDQKFMDFIQKYLNGCKDCKYAGGAKI